MRTLTRGRLVPRQPRTIKNTTRTELRGETIVGVAWLKIKGEMVCGISSCKIRRNTERNDAFYPVICYTLQDDLTYFRNRQQRFGLTTTNYREEETKGGMKPTLEYYNINNDITAY